MSTVTYYCIPSKNRCCSNVLNSLGCDKGSSEHFGDEDLVPHVTKNAGATPGMLLSSSVLVLYNVSLLKWLMEESPTPSPHLHRIDSWLGSMCDQQIWVWVFKVSICILGRSEPIFLLCILIGLNLSDLWSQVVIPLHKL